MIRHSTLTSQIRFFKEPTTDPFAPYDAICTLTWESADTVWLVGLHGDFNRKFVRELLSFLHDRGVTTVKAFRAPGHGLPFAEYQGDNLFVIDIQKAHKTTFKPSE